LKWNSFLGTYKFSPKQETIEFWGIRRCTTAS